MFLQSVRVSARFFAVLACAAGIAQAANPGELSGSPAWLGSPSCSARACHGSAGPQRSHPLVWGFEHSVWHVHDRHRKAYAVLLEPRSQQMSQRLGLEQPAHLARECLACHAPAASADTTPPVLGDCTPAVVSEGVGCETCHGAAHRWIAAHTSADWRLLSPLEKEHIYGFRNTKDLVQRAELCVSCHVGSPDGDVNHDLIAAGHPRLTFEYASFLHRMPPHWDERAENDRALRPEFEARVWTIGQVAAAKAQLELLATRAEAAAENRSRAVWPEFAEYNCYACHRELGAHGVTGTKAPPGKPAWGTWNYALLPLVAHAPDTVDPRLEAVARVMSNLSADERVAADEARRAARHLEAWLTAASAASYDSRLINEQRLRLAQRGLELSAGEWDIAAQLYLALAAWQQAQLDVQGSVTPEDAAVRRLLGATRRELMAPSSINRSPEAFAKHMRQLHQSLAR